MSPVVAPSNQPGSAAGTADLSEEALERAQLVKKVEEDILAKLRLSLVRYLSRALMEESSR